jgi:hypothetical protein
VTIHHWLAPDALLGDSASGGHVVGVRFARQALVGGRLQATGLFETLDADMVFKAIGQKLDSQLLTDCGLSLRDGRVLADGIDLAVVTPDSLRRQIAVVPQECFLFDATVRENIAVGAHLRRASRSAALAHAEHVAQQVGLAGQLDKLALNLTVAGRKRLELARALATEAEQNVKGAEKLLDRMRATASLDCAGRTPAMPFATTTAAMSSVRRGRRVTRSPAEAWVTGPRGRLVPP